MNTDGWLTLEQTVEALQATLGRQYIVVTPSKIRSWLQSGKLIGQRVNGEWRVNRHDIEAFARDWKWGRNLYQGGGFSGR